MPSSAVRTFNDPDEYAAAILGGEVELTVAARGDFHAKLIRIDLHCLWMQRFADNLPRVIHSAHVPGRASVKFRTAPGPSFFAASLEIRSTNLVRHSLADNYHQRSSGAAHFGTMSLPVEDMAALGETMAGADLTPPRDTMLITPPPSAVAKLQRLHAAAGDLAKKAPEILANADAARGLEQALIEALVGCLADRDGRRKNNLAQGQHTMVMRRFRRVVEENPEQPLYIPEICRAIGVSQRTLRMCCREHLGMGPRRYLLLRRMGLARRALRHAAPDATSVTAIGTRYGFWELGRFAVEYQALFGESPSATLYRRAA